MKSLKEVHYDTHTEESKINEKKSTNAQCKGTEGSSR